MTCDEAKSLIGTYVKWLQEKTSLTDVSGFCEITTPFLDRHNDAVVIYMERRGLEIVLSDDGYTLADLSMTGVEMTPNRRSILDVVLNGFGVSYNDGELAVATSVEDFPRRKHDLVQAILTVNDMFMTGRETVRSLFLEEVEAFLRKREVHFSRAVSFKGASGMDHTFDFLVPPSPMQPERLIQAVARPEKQSIITKVLFPFTDVKDRRPTKVKLYAFLNDQEKIPSDLLSYVRNCGADPVVWSDREAVVEALTAV